MVASPSPLVDLHCHLDLYPDFPAAVRKCEEAGIFTLAVTTTPRAWERNNELTAGTRHVRAALGLHPQLVSEHAHEMAIFESLLPRTRYVGEVGLDAGPRYYKSLDLQKRVFRRILELCSIARNKILTVHSVRAVGPVLDLIELNLAPEQGRVVLHWFTGTTAQLKRAVEMGCYFSVNAQMLNGDKRLAMVKQMPIDRILTETDGPFTEVMGRAAEPADVSVALELLSRVYHVSSEQMKAQVAQNLRELLIAGDKLGSH
jgi:TatD DNase family protein